MSLKLIFYTLGNLLICLAGTMLFPLGVAIYYQVSTGEVHSDLSAFITSTILTCIIGLMLRFSFPARQEELGIRRRFRSCGFRMGNRCTLLAALPYLFAETFHTEGRSSWTAFSFCYFESMAGFSTTRCHSPYRNRTSLTCDALLAKFFTLAWRDGNCRACCRHSSDARYWWDAALSRRGTGAPKRSGLTPRIAQTAKLLWGVYLLLSLVETVLLMLGGMVSFRRALSYVWHHGNGWVLNKKRQHRTL